jgi:hypothetical protein
MRAVLIASFAVCVVACTPPSSPTPPAQDTSTASAAGETLPADPERDAMIATLTPAVSADIGQPISFVATSSRTQGDWGWLIAQPWTPQGAALDWSQTRYADRAQAGVLDGGGTTYALLKRVNGAWTVTAFAVGPTDVAYNDWPQRYGAPPELLGLPTR